jgi:hypothetical protein
MRLTVGPLPPAIYWRRRAAILGILLLIVLLVFYSCSNASDAARKKRVLTPTTGAPPSATASAPRPTYTPSGGPSVQAGDPPADSSGDQPNVPAGGSTADTVTQTGPCTDGELALTATAEPPSVARAAFVKFTLRIKNTSTRSCTRDVGADPQELYLQDDAKAKIWSSDACEPLHGTDVRTFKPGDAAEFYVVWNGKATNAGCANQQPPPTGRYQLVGRLSTKLSDPSPIEIK